MAARKNGINRELYPIEGGVCAPNGFSANAVYAGFTQNPDKPDFAFIVSDKRCPAAAVFSTNAVVGAPVTVSKRHLKHGVAYGVLINSGVANVFQKDGEELAEKVSQMAANSIIVDRADILIASTGKIGPKLHLKTFEDVIKPLSKGLKSTNENSLLAAQAIMTTDKNVKQLSYRFEIGDYSCKIGAIFKGSQRVSPNMATTLGVITTDVNISSEMLNQAFLSASKNILNLLDIDGVASPNDMFCILANGRAGNYKIEQADCEYEKFYYILKEFMLRICKEIAKDGEHGKVLLCRVRGTKSKQVARKLAKKVATSLELKKLIAENTIDVETIISALTDVDVVEDYSELYMHVESAKGKFVIFESSQTMLFSKELMATFLDDSEVELYIDLRKGNFSATSISGV